MVSGSIAVEEMTAGMAGQERMDRNNPGMVVVLQCYLMKNHSRVEQRGCVQNALVRPSPPTLRFCVLIRLPRIVDDPIVQHAVMQRSCASPAADVLRAVVKKQRVCNGSLDCRRGLQDVAITRTGRPIIRIQGGRYCMARF